MKPYKFWCIQLFLLCSALTFAQAPQQPHTLTAPQKIEVPSSKAKDALYTAIHKKDQADKAVADLNVRIAQIQQQATQQFQQLDVQQKAADKAVAEAEAALLKEMKLDPEKWTLNHETMEATAKPQNKSQNTGVDGGPRMATKVSIPSSPPKEAKK